METLTDYLNKNKSLDNPGAYEFYQLEATDNISQRFIIKNIVTNQSMLVKSTRNKIEIDNNFQSYGDLGKKISVIKFLERLKGIGVNYIN
jgi:hypothetical protein